MALRRLTTCGSKLLCIRDVMKTRCGDRQSRRLLLLLPPPHLPRGGGVIVTLQLARSPQYCDVQREKRRGENDVILGRWSRAAPVNVVIHTFTSAIERTMCSCRVVVRPANKRLLARSRYFGPTRCLMYVRFRRYENINVQMATK